MELFMNINIYRKGLLLLGALAMASLVPLASKAATEAASAKSDPSSVVMTVTATAKKNAQAMESEEVDATIASLEATA